MDQGWATIIWSSGKVGDELGLFDLPKYYLPVGEQAEQLFLELQRTLAEAGGNVFEALKLLNGVPAAASQEPEQQESAEIPLGIPGLGWVDHTGSAPISTPADQARAATTVSGDAHQASAYSGDG